MSQWYSFDSEIEYISKHVIMEDSINYKTGIPALLFEALKSILVGIAIRNFLMYDGYYSVIVPAAFGLALSYGSWWMSDQGTRITASRQAGLPPADTRTGTIARTYGRDISSIDTEIDGIEAREFHWCAEHKKAHTCDSELNSFYIDPVKDRKHVRRINKLKLKRDRLMEAKDSLIRQSGADFGKASKLYEEGLKSLESTLANKVLLAEVATWLALSFMMYVQYRLRQSVTPDHKPDKEEKPSSPKDTPPPPDKGEPSPQPNGGTAADGSGTASDTGGVPPDTEGDTAPVPQGGIAGTAAVPAMQRQFSIEDLKEASIAYLTLSKEHPDLLEEIIAQRERLKGGGTEGQGK